jgi:hypothetical protein
MVRHRVTATALFAALLVLPFAVSAEPAGLAYDSVTKISMKGDASSQQPGDFNADFATAAAVQMPDQGGGGGFFAKLNQAMTMGKSMQQMMQSGFAERRYVAGTKERTDNLSTQTATIVDCAARTITRLDLRRKTYKTESMDRAESSGGEGGAPGSPVHDDGTRIAITVANSALGSRQIGGQDTSGYRSDMTITETKPSGESQTQKGNIVAYYSSYANPAMTCSHAGPTVPGGMAMMGNFAQLMRALSGSGLDKRVTIKQSGPPLPLGKVSMFSAVTFTGGQGAGMTFVTERGNVRAISDGDPVFSIPSDFTQQQ